MDKDQLKPGEKHVTRSELLLLMEPLDEAIIELTSAVVDLAQVAKNLSDDPSVIEKGESAYTLLGRVIDKLKEYNSTKDRILSPKEQDNE